MAVGQMLDAGAPRSFVVQGRTVTVPVVVRDAVSVTAMFVVPTVAVRRLMPHPALHIPELLPGRALCVLAAVEYLDNDLGRYNEIAVTFFATVGGPPPTPLLGLVSAFRAHRLAGYIHRLPVTTTFSRDAGHDIWGFPKTVDEITFQDEGGQRTCTLAVDGVHVLTLTVTRGGRGRMAPMPQDALAVRDGVLWRTPSVMHGEGVGTRLGGATLTLGRHPIADELRSLGLPKRALLSTSMEHMRAEFEAPERL
ncbi:MAG TPA: acetoacetate decarboxylase family protein [Candidatus Binatia bacterium]|jgi:hypothetical protein|nr:acetoacetate decarboxylase family protein [Candidatus Binatia bacterium]